MTFRLFPIALLLAACLEAQLSTSSQLNGTVTDVSGALVEGQP